jgi:HsdM-like protein
MNDSHYYFNFIWQIADLLRGPYRRPQYERVMLPLTVLRRFDCVRANETSGLTILLCHQASVRKYIKRFEKVKGKK